MKLLFVLLTLWSGIARAQAPLFITTDKTTSLVFPFPVKYVDRGTKDVIVQPVKENDHILLVKAACRQFPETNLSVVAGDGNVYEFTVSYQEHPAELVVRVPASQTANISTYAYSILDNRSRKILRAEKNNVIAIVSGIYIKDDVIYCQLQLCNHSPVDYDIDVLKFFIRDKKQGKRTAVQEQELPPLFVAGNKTKVKAYDFSVVVVALEKFTVPDAKYLGIQILEKNGGRHFQLKIQNGQLMKAVILPDLR